MRSRFKRELKNAALLAAIGFTYLIAVRITGLAIPCIFNKLTGLLCPACGITRSIAAVSRLDFYSAFGYNKALFILMPIIAALILSEEIRYIKSGKREPLLISKIILWIMIALLIGFGIIRNL